MALNQTKANIRLKDKNLFLGTMKKVNETILPVKHFKSLPKKYGKSHVKSRYIMPEYVISYKLP